MAYVAVGVYAFDDKRYCDSMVVTKYLFVASFCNNLLLHAAKQATKTNKRCGIHFNYCDTRSMCDGIRNTKVTTQNEIELTEKDINLIYFIIFNVLLIGLNYCVD